MIEIVAWGDGVVAAAAVWAAVWLVAWLVFGTVMLAMAWACGRSASPGVRELLWRTALAGSLVTAGVVVIAGAERQATSTLPLPVRMQLRGEVSIPAGAPAKLRVPAAAVVPTWLLLALAACVRLDRRRRRHWREAGPRETLVDEDVVALLRSLQQRAGSARTIYLTTSASITGPAAIGSAEICLPGGILARLSPDQRESVLAHELAHVLRRDPAWRIGVQVLMALLPVQPLLRIAARELRECAEMLCDDLAVRLTGNRRALVESLALLVEPAGFDGTAATAFAEPGSALARRAHRILAALPAASMPRAAPALAVLVLACCATAGATVPVVRPADAHRTLRVITTEIGPGTRTPLRREATVRITPEGPVLESYRENATLTEPGADARAWLDTLMRQHRVD